MDFRRAPHTPTVPPQIQQWQWWRLYNLWQLLGLQSGDMTHRGVTPAFVICVNCRCWDSGGGRTMTSAPPKKVNHGHFLEALQTEFVMMKWMSCRAVGRPKSWKKILAQSVGMWLIITSLLCFREKKEWTIGWSYLQTLGLFFLPRIQEKQRHAICYPNNSTRLFTECSFLCVSLYVYVREWKKPLRFFKCNFCHVYSLQRCSGTHSLSSRCLLSPRFRRHSPPGLRRRPLGSSTNKPLAWISF